MILPDRIFLIAVPYSWYQSVMAQYIASGSGNANCWGVRLKRGSAIVNPDPGALVLFRIQRDGKSLICGGGFFQRLLDLEPEQAWTLFGVNNGCESFEEFERVIREHGWRKGRKLSSNLVCGTFMFSSGECYEIPQEIGAPALEDGEMSSFPLDAPEGRFLANYIMRKRSFELRSDTADCGWPGIFRMAEEKHARDYTAVFTAMMMQAYDFKCAVTGEALVPVLEVAHIRTFYDERFLKPDNGLVLRSDIERLFTSGYITACYKDDDHAVIKVSSTLEKMGGGNYMQYDGCELALPADISLRPSKNYLKWHSENRFENWLSFGAVRPEN